MNIFEVKDMTCGHCVSVVTKAINAVAPGAAVRIDLATHRVTIDGTDVNSLQVGKAIRDAGYSAVAVDDVVATASKPAAPARKACCCG